MRLVFALLLTSILKSSFAQDSTRIAPTHSVTALSEASKNTGNEKKTHWYDKISLRGYVQIRYNRMLETNADLKIDQGDRSIGNNGGFFIRRARLIFFGQLSEHVYFYIQPDLASSASATSLHFAQIRDAYFDVSLDKKREFRFRIGQSKVPFGFENMQSSQNRLPLDRSESLNSALPNERDLGVFFYYAPKKIRALYSTLVNDGYKGSGDYGVLAFGLYNGATANRPESNNNQYWVARASYPIELPWNQIIEPGLQMYSGMYKLDQTSSGVKTTKNAEYLDERMAASFVIYPRPFGLQAEYNIGKGPQYNKIKDSVETADLRGGYITLNYFLKVKNHFLYPFVRYSYYDGGKKFELDARHYRLDDIEAGIEWQPVKNFELTTSWLYSDRTTSDKTSKTNYQFGSFLRVQAQLNF
ncbi:MAG: porin [Sediminibacterium sp.]|nr:porin [Sediminibacterium sp.]